MRSILKIAFYMYATLSWVVNLYQLIIGISIMSAFAGVSKIIGVLFAPLSMITVWI